MELGGSTADNQIIEYTFLGGQVRHYKMVGAGHVSEPKNSLAKQIMLDIITKAAGFLKYNYINQCMLITSTLLICVLFLHDEISLLFPYVR